MGYVVAAMSYRLGVNIFNVTEIQDEFVKAVWRGVHDSRAAVRFFRKSAQRGNPYGIDPNRIYLGGERSVPSLPCIMPMWTTTAKSQGRSTSREAGLEGGLEGASGNPELHSSEVQGVFNIAGALQTVDYFNEEVKTNACSASQDRGRNGALRRRDDFIDQHQHH